VRFPASERFLVAIPQAIFAAPPLIERAPRISPENLEGACDPVLQDGSRRGEEQRDGRVGKRREPALNESAPALRCFPPDNFSAAATEGPMAGVGND